MFHPQPCSGISILLLVLSVTHGLANAQTSATTTSLSADPTSLTYPGTVTLTSTVTPTNTRGIPSGHGVPTGNISFSSNGSAIGSGVLSLVPNTQNLVAQSLLIGEL